MQSTRPVPMALFALVTISPVALFALVMATAILAQDLLVERSIDVTLNNGEQMSVNGFHVVDMEKLSKLPDDIVLAWHRNGYLALVHHHLSSLSRFNALVQRQSLKAAAKA